MAPFTSLAPGVTRPPAKRLRDADIALVCRPTARFVELSDQLKSAGCTVQFYVKPGGALFQVREQGPDLLLLDVQLRDEGGLELCALLTAEEGDALPVIAVAADGDADERAEAMAAGAADFLEPDLSPEALAHRLGLQLRVRYYKHLIRRRNASQAASHEVLSSFAATMQARAEQRSEELSRAQAARMDSERTTGSLLRAESWAAALLTPKGELIEANESFTEGLSLGPDAPPRFTLKRQLPALHPLLHELRASLRRVSLEFEVSPGVWWDAALEPVLDEGGELARIIMLASDTSEARSLRRAGSIKRALLQHCSEAIGATDHRGALSFANPALLTILGLERVPLGENLCTLLVGARAAHELRATLDEAGEAVIQLQTPGRPKVAIRAPAIAEDAFIGRAFYIQPLP